MVFFRACSFKLIYTGFFVLFSLSDSAAVSRLSTDLRGRVGPRAGGPGAAEPAAKRRDASTAADSETRSDRMKAAGATAGNRRMFSMLQGTLSQAKTEQPSKVRAGRGLFFPLLFLFFLLLF